MTPTLSAAGDLHGLPERVLAPPNIYAGHSNNQQGAHNIGQQYAANTAPQQGFDAAKKVTGRSALLWMSLPHIPPTW
jgi:hypothetical protein